MEKKFLFLFKLLIFQSKAMKIIYYISNLNFFFKGIKEDLL